jgi:hypothetical protein
LKITAASINSENEEFHAVEELISKESEPNQQLGKCAQA